eukprot:COSAG02_NODE_52291_length_308_cov_1.727273_1_plen_78_part_01
MHVPALQATPVQIATTTLTSASLVIGFVRMAPAGMKETALTLLTPAPLLQVLSIARARSVGAVISATKQTCVKQTRRY